MRTSKNPTAAKPDDMMKRANFFMPPAMLDGLNQLAKAKKTTSAKLVRRGVASMLKRHGISV